MSTTIIITSTAPGTAPSFVHEGSSHTAETEVLEHAFDL